MRLGKVCEKCYKIKLKSKSIKIELLARRESESIKSSASTLGGELPTKEFVRAR